MTGLTPELDSTHRTAGDRGLALVVVGLIGIGLAWRGTYRAPAALSVPARTDSGYFAQAAQRREARALERLTRRVADDYRQFERTLHNLAAMRTASVPFQPGMQERILFEYLAALEDRDLAPAKLDSSAHPPRALEPRSFDHPAAGSAAVEPDFTQQ